MTGLETISVSKLGLCLRCGEGARRRYIEGDKIPPNIARARGTGVHEASRVNLRQKSWYCMKVRQQFKSSLRMIYGNVGWRDWMIAILLSIGQPMFAILVPYKQEDVLIVLLGMVLSLASWVVLLIYRGVVSAEISDKIEMVRRGDGKIRMKDKDAPIPNP